MPTTQENYIQFKAIISGIDGTSVEDVKIKLKNLLEKEGLIKPNISEKSLERILSQLKYVFREAAETGKKELDAVLGTITTGKKKIDISIVKNRELEVAKADLKKQEELLKSYTEKQDGLISKGTKDERTGVISLKDKKDFKEFEKLDELIPEVQGKIAQLNLDIAKLSEADDLKLVKTGFKSINPDVENLTKKIHILNAAIAESKVSLYKAGGDDSVISLDIEKQERELNRMLSERQGMVGKGRSTPGVPGKELFSKKALFEEQELRVAAGIEDYETSQSHQRIIEAEKESLKDQLNLYREINSVQKDIYRLQQDPTIHKKELQAQEKLLETLKQQLRTEQDRKFVVSTVGKELIGTQEERLISTQEVGVAKLEDKTAYQEQQEVRQQELQSYQEQNKILNDILTVRREINRLSIDPESHKNELEAQEKILETLQNQLQAEKDKKLITDEGLIEAVTRKEGKITTLEDVGVAKESDIKGQQELNEKIQEFNFVQGEAIKLKTKLQYLERSGYTDKNKGIIKLREEVVATEAQANSIRKELELNSQNIQVKNALIKATQKATAAKHQETMAIAEGVRKETIWDRLVKAVQRVAFYTITYRALRLLVNGFKDAIQTVIEFDKTMTEIKMITNASSKEIARIGKEFGQLASEVGATASEVAVASRMWLQQGKTVEETAKLTKASMVFSKVAMIESAQATEYLTATMNAYGISVDNVMSIVDKMASIDMAAAVSSSELAEALSRTANSARLAGVEIEQVLSYIAAVTEVTRAAPSKVGESFKSIFARMGNVRTGAFISDEGEDISDVQTVLTKIGVDLLDKQTGQFRSMALVLDEVAIKWKNLTSIEKNATAGALAGVRQREMFISLMESYDRALYLEEEALNSSGFAMQKMEIYMDSIGAKMTDLTNTWKEFGKELVEGDLVKGIIDIGKTLLNIFKGIFNFLDSGFGKVVLGIVVLVTTMNLVNFAIMKYAAFTATASGTTTGFGFAIKKMIANLTGMSLATDLATGKVILLNTALSTTTFIITGLIAIIAIAVIAAKAYDAAQQKIIDDALELYNSSIEVIEQQNELISKTTDLKKKLEDIATTGGGFEDLIKLQDELSSALGKTVNVLDMISKGYTDASSAAKQYIKEVEIIEAMSAIKTKEAREQAFKGAKTAFESDKAKTFKTDWYLDNLKLSKIKQVFDAQMRGVGGTAKDYWLPSKIEDTQFTHTYRKYNEQLKKADSDMRKWIYNRAKPLGTIYAENILSSFENASPILAGSIQDIVINAISFAENEIEANIISKNLQPQLDKINNLTNQYVEALASGEQNDFLKAGELLGKIQAETENLTKLYPLAAKSLKDYYDGLNSVYILQPPIVESIERMTAVISKQVKALKDLASQYKALSDSEKSYFDLKKNILKEFEDLTLEEMRLALDITGTVKEGEPQYVLDSEGEPTSEIETVTPTTKTRTGQYSDKIDAETIRILEEIDKLSNKYQEDLVEDVLLQTEITAEYKRQLAMLEKQFSINQKNLEIQKEQIKLQSAQNERNTRMFIDGRWQLVANPEAVAQAEEAMRKLEQEKNMAQIEMETQEQVDKTIKAGEEVEASIKVWENITKQMSEGSLDVTKSFNKLKDMAHLLSSAFTEILTKTMGQKKYAELLEKEGIEPYKEPYDDGGSLGSKKGMFFKNTTQEEVVLSPKNTIATKSLLNRLPRLESLVNGIMGKFGGVPSVKSNYVGNAGNSGDTFNVNNLNVKYDGNDFDGFIKQMKTVVATK